MSEKDAKVRLELAAGGFLSMLQEIERKAKELGQEIEGVGEAGEKAEKKLHPALGSIKKGFGAARDSIADLGKELKSTLGQVATLGGAVSFGALVHSAIELNDLFDDIAWNVNKVAGNAETVASVQRDIETAAADAKVPVEEMAAAYEKVFKSTGDLKYTKAALEVIGTTATASGESVENLANVAQLLQRKFKVASADLPEAMARFVEKTGVGGKSLDDLSNRFALMAGEASEAGMAGADGISQLLGILNQLDSAVGEKADPALKAMFQTLKNGSGALKNLEKQAGIKFAVDDTAFQKIEKLLSTTRGRKAAEQVFGGEARVVFDELARPFDEAVATAKAEGKKGKELRDAGIAAFEANLAAAGKSAMSYGDIQKRFAEAKTGPKEQLNDAINQLKASFTKPEVVSSLEKLATLLPKVASGMASLLEFGVNHPVLAGAGLLGGKALGAAGSSIGGDLMGAAGKGLAGVGKSIGRDLAAQAAVSGAWKTAGANLGVAAGIAVAAAVAYELGKAAIDSVYEDKAKDQGDLAMAGANAAGAVASGNQARMAKEADTLRARIATAKKNREGIGGFMDDTFGAAAQLFSGGEVKGDVQANVIAKAEAELRGLEEAMANGAKGGDKVAQAHDRAAQAAERLAKAMDKIQAPSGGGGGKNGLPPAPGNQSGSAPR
jgi:hypothetical protein